MKASRNLEAFLVERMKFLTEIKIGPNDDGQRADRFLRKYLSKASKGFIYKMIRKKNIKLNGKRFKPEDFIKEGDTMQLYFSDETLAKFTESEEEIMKKIDLDIVYEDENIVIIDKPAGMLSHSANGDYSEKDAVSGIVAYLHAKGDYNPRKEKTFRPSICNRLDRNTSGLLIGAKNYEALKEINDAIRNRSVGKYYKTVVKGKLEKEMHLKGYMTKDENRNRVFITEEKKHEDDREVETKIRPLKTSSGYSLIEIDLITGRTHQIRAHLSYEGYPVAGDRKYGNKRVNSEFKEKYGLENQLLHASRLEFDGLEGELSYLNGKTVEAEDSSILSNIEKDLF